MLGVMTAERTEITLHINAPYATGVDERALIALALRVFEAEGTESAGDLIVRLVDDTTVRELNRRFRDVDEVTDVLSFGMDGDVTDSDPPATNDDFITPPGSDPQLGEVVIAYPTAERQATEAGHDVGAELDHLLVHGVLHLLGYDHETEAEEREMRSREEAILGRRVHGDEA